MKKGTVYEKMHDGLVIKLSYCKALSPKGTDNA